MSAPTADQGSSSGARSPLSPLEITIRLEDADTVLLVAGEVDIASVPTLSACLDETFAGLSGRVVIDLSGVSFLDSTGLDAIVRANNALRSAEREMVIRNPQHPVRQVFEITGLTGYIAFDPAGPLETAVD